MSTNAHHGSPRSPRSPRPIVAVVIVALLAAGVYAGVRAIGPAVPEQRTSSPRSPSASPVPSVASVSPSSPPPAAGPFSVGRVMLSLVDATRKIAPPHSGSADDIPRRLPTVVWFPRVPPGSSAPSRGFPLIVFAHGFDLTPTTYRLLLRSWARAGYVVAAPTFPLTSPEAVGGLDESDIVNQPGDVRFVIGRLLRADRSAASPLHALIDPAEVAVAGHSDGGETAFAVAFDACCRDARIRAAIVMSGAALTLGGGLSDLPAPPLLVVQGTADSINAPENSTRLFDVATGPKEYLRLKGAEHLPPFTEPGPYERVVSRVSLDFLNAYLKHLRGAREKLMTDGHATPRLASIESGR